jgi:hypothetical protein
MFYYSEIYTKIMPEDRLMVMLSIWTRFRTRADQLKKSISWNQADRDSTGRSLWNGRAFSEACQYDMEAKYCHGWEQYAAQQCLSFTLCFHTYIQE